MPRELKSATIRVIRRSNDSAPELVECDYQVEDGDLKESMKKYVHRSPDFTKRTSTFTREVVAKVKAREGL